MSQVPPPGFNTPYQPVQKSAPPKENGFGLAGFIVSIAGIFLCGIPSLIGVVLSLIGFRKHPKGFAIAGLVIGLVGLLELVLVGFLAYSTYQVGKSASNFIQNLPVFAELYDEARVVGDKWIELDRIPTQEEGDELLKDKRDFTGNPFVYETDGESFSVRTAGPDNTLHTEDDNTVGPFYSPEEIPTSFDPNGGDFDPATLEDMLDEIEAQNDLIE